MQRSCRVAGAVRKQTRRRVLPAYWLEHVVEPELRPTSYRGYKTMVRRHIGPVLGGRYLVDLCPADARRPLAVLREETTGLGSGLRTLSPRVVQFAHAVLGNALSNAVREELVGRNVAKMVRTRTPEYEVGGRTARAPRAPGRRADRRREGWAASGFVFTNRRGEPLSPYSPTEQWHDVRARAGVPTPRSHDLRHTAVSLLLALGVPPHVVREIAGHSDIEVTMTVHAHGHLSGKASRAHPARNGRRGALRHPCRRRSSD